MNFNNINTVVQIGANAGYDDLTPIIYKHKETINKFIAVEPLILHNESLNKCYSSISGFIIDNRIITTDTNQKQSTLYYNTNDGPGFEIASLDPSHIKKHMTPMRKDLSSGEIKSSTVPAITLNNLFKLHNLKHIDLLVIDVEGWDLKLIMDINFDEFNIDCIIYEHIHINKNTATEYLTAKGYVVDVGWVTGNWSSIANKI